MAASHLTPVSETDTERAKGEVVEFGRSGGDQVLWRMRQLQFEARALARDQVEALARELGAIASRAAEIAEGGDAYPVGVRELCSRLAEDLPRKNQLLQTLARRDG
jgi:hypothetical protein